MAAAGNSSAVSASAASMYANTTKKAAVVLPRGWERKATPKGKIYYLDHNTCTSHWELPKTDRGASNKKGGSSNV